MATRALPHTEQAQADPQAASARRRAPPSPLESCLLEFAQHLGRPLSLSLLRSGLPQDVEQADETHLHDIALTAGMQVRRVDHRASHMEEGDLPALVIGDDGRPAIILEFLEDGEAEIIEPGRRPERFVLKEQPFYHEARGFYSIDPDVSRLNKRWGWFWRPLAQNKWAYGQVVIAALMTNLLAVSTSIFTMVVYDRVLPNGATESLVALTIGVSIALIFDWIIKTLRGHFLDGAGSRADIQIGQRLFDHLLAIDLSSKRDSVGGLSSVMREFENLRDFLASASLIALIDLPFVLLFIAVIYMIGGPVAIIPAVLVPLVIIVGVIVQPFLNQLAAEDFEEGKQKQSVLVETISGLETLKVSTASREMRRRWRDALTRQANSSIKTRILGQVVVNFSAFAQQVAQVGVVTYGAILVSQGQLTMGGLIASVILAGRCMAPLGQVAHVMSRIVQAKTAFRALDEFMRRPLDRPLSNKWLTRDHLDGEVEFRGVGFTYPDSQTPVLRDVSFHIQPGEKVALLGKIGSGKSTLSRLMLGLYHPQQGSVMIDGTEVRQIDPFDLRNNMAIVMQESWLFSGTIRENIAAGAEQPSDEAVLDAAKKAGVHDFLADHPQGYDLKISERGEGLSGGQKQAIAIARALVADPAVLILDEPTSMMDMSAEARFVERLNAVAADKTLIIITHRTALLELADRVVVLDQGRVAADGPKSILKKGAQGQKQ
ncbi:type I secretion system permease/ATPase [Spiribacter sp. 1M153]|uniref:type I secretion system permease/ATPase n=1 Tax=Spiribacter TaxID=1335745 RepID=UPI00132F9C56|nr:type I secretion system permease/ATPase [Spiribacter sp. SSL99]KAF0284938.1 ATPase [Spiribacter sp. SSL99]